MRSLIGLSLVLALSVAGLAGTRFYRSLQEVLRTHSKPIVFEAEVTDWEFSQWESYDVLDCQIENSNWIWGDGVEEKVMDKLRFMAYRPAPTSPRKNASVYSEGSGLEFALKKGQRYIFICSTSSSLIRIEPLSSKEQILKFCDHR